MRIPISEFLISEAASCFQYMYSVAHRYSRVCCANGRA